MGRVFLFLHVVVPLVFFTNLTPNPYLIQISTLHATLFLCVAAGAILFLYRGRLVWKTTPWDGPLLLFALYATFRSLFQMVVPNPLGLSTGLESVKGLIFLWSNVVFVYFLAARLSASALAPTLRRCVWAVGGVAALYGLAQYLGWDPFWKVSAAPFEGRPLSTYGNPNFLSTVLVLLLPRALWGMVRGSTSKAWGYGALALLFVLALISTMTRSSYVGGAAAVILWAILDRSAWRGCPRRVWVWGGLLLLAVGVLAPLAPHNTFRPVSRLVELWNGIFSGDPYGAWHQRKMIWTAAARLWADFPLTGAGWGLFELYYPFYQGPLLSSSVYGLFRTHANNAHQFLLEIGATTGVVGLGGVVWMAVLAFRFRKPETPRSLTDGVALWAGLAGAVVDNMLGNVSLFFATPAFLFFWVAGTWAGRFGVERVVAIPWKAPGRWAAVAFVPLCCWGAVHEFRVFQSARWHLMGEQLLRQGDERGAERSWNTARRWFRGDVLNAYERGNLHLRWAQRSQDQKLEQETIRQAALAEAAFTEAIRANGGYDEIYFNRAAARDLLGRREEARSDLRRSLQIHPTSERTLKALAWLDTALDSRSGS